MKKYNASYQYSRSLSRPWIEFHDFGFRYQVHLQLCTVFDVFRRGFENFILELAFIIPAVALSVEQGVGVLIDFLLVTYRFLFQRWGWVAFTLLTSFALLG